MQATRAAYASGASSLCRSPPLEKTPRPFKRPRASAASAPAAAQALMTCSYSSSPLPGAQRVRLPTLFGRKGVVGGEIVWPLAARQVCRQGARLRDEPMHSPPKQASAHVGPRLVKESITLSRLVVSSQLPRSPYMALSSCSGSVRMRGLMGCRGMLPNFRMACAVSSRATTPTWSTSFSSPSNVRSCRAGGEEAGWLQRSYALAEALAVPDSHQCTASRCIAELVGSPKQRHLASAGVALPRHTPEGGRCSAGAPPGGCARGRPAALPRCPPRRP